MKTSAKIIVSRSSFQMETLIDESPDLSWIGEYSNSPGDEDKTINRQERGDKQRNEYRYFIAAMSGEDTGNPESVEQDYQRMESYNSGQWQMIGIRATVALEIPIGNAITLQEITSPGVWGIESDSDEEHFKEVFADECSILAEMIEALGNVELVD